MKNMICAIFTEAQIIVKDKVTDKSRTPYIRDILDG